VCIDPISQTVDTPNTFNVDVVIDDVSGLGAFELRIEFDPTVVQGVSIDKGSFLGSTGRDAQCAPNLSANSISLTCVTLNTVPPGASGSGTLATAVFSATAAGTTALHLAGVLLTDPAAVVIPTQTTDGSVTVAIGPTATPCPGVCPTSTSTFTPTPTSTNVPGPTFINLNPAIQGVALNSLFTIAVDVVAVENLGAYEFELLFDPAFVMPLSAGNATFLGSTGRSVSCPSPVLGERTVQLACATAGLSPPGPSGSGTLASVVFKAVGVPAFGSTLISLQSGSLADPLGDPQAAALGGAAQVNVVVVPTATPTACPGVCDTATPSSTPTATATATPVPPTVSCPDAFVSGVCVFPETQTRSVNEVFSVFVTAVGVSGVGAFQFTLNFDGSIVEAVDVGTGGFLGSTGRLVSCAAPVITASAASLACVTLGPAPPGGASGTGILAEVVLRGLTSGLTALTLSDVVLLEPTGVAIPIALAPGVVTVGTGPTATPTNTPIPPTATPTDVPGSLGCSGLPGVRLCIRPVSQTVSAGNQFDVEIQVDNVTDLGAFEFALSYDEALLDFVSVSDGSYLGSTGRTVTCLPPILNPGLARFACASSGTQSGPSGEGLLAVVRFTAVSSGSSPLALALVSLANPLGDDIPALGEDGSVTIP
jgi:hypothetical protein